MVRVDAAVQEHLAECGEIGRGAEETGVTGHSANGEGVFVVNFAVHQAVPQVVVDFRWRDAGPEFLRRAEHGIFHAERREDVGFCEVVERVAG